MLNWLKRFFRAQPARPAVTDAMRLIHSRYDAAVTSDANRRHWEGADNLSANAANSPEVRRILRTRSRYEIANNSYARGIVLTLANDTIGTGPRLQMLTTDAAANRQIERAFQNWSRAVCLPIPVNQELVDVDREQKLMEATGTLDSNSGGEIG